MAFKARKLSDSIMESQDSFIMREFEDAEVYFGDDGEDVVATQGVMQIYTQPIRGIQT